MKHGCSINYPHAERNKKLNRCNQCVANITCQHLIRFRFCQTVARMCPIQRLANKQAFSLKNMSSPSNSPISPISTTNIGLFIQSAIRRANNFTFCRIGIIFGSNRLKKRKTNSFVKKLKMTREQR